MSIFLYQYLEHTDVCVVILMIIRGTVVWSRLSSPLTHDIHVAPYAQSYSLPAYPVNSYTVQPTSGWYNFATGQYIVQPQVAAVSNLMLILYFKNFIVTSATRGGDTVITVVCWFVCFVYLFVI